jgi:hypothetical protein
MPKLSKKINRSRKVSRRSAKRSAKRSVRRRTRKNVRKTSRRSNRKNLKRTSRKNMKGGEGLRGYYDEEHRQWVCGSSDDFCGAGAGSDCEPFFDNMDPCGSRNFHKIFPYGWKG